MLGISKEIEQLKQMSVAELLECYTELHGKSPRCKNRTWLWKRCAWRLQERRYGGLSAVARRRLDALIAEIDHSPMETPRGASRPFRRPGKGKHLAVGTILVRQWHEQDIQVVVREGGFEWDGQIYRSLTAVVRAVTDQHWNAKLFFGITTRRKSR